VSALLAWPLLWALVSARPADAPARRPSRTLDYDGLLRLLRQGAGDKEVLRRLEISPALRALSEQQVASLGARGATPAVIAALRRQAGQEIHSDARNVGIVLDCSASMLDSLPDGRTKLEVARKLVTGIIRRIPEGKNLTLVTYGQEPQEKKCEDVEVVQPLAPVTAAMKDRLEKYVKDIVPLGYTPLALAMQTAGKELAKEKGICMLVVITDGVDTCKGEPGDVAEQLVKDLLLPGGVDVIGMGVNDQELKALKELARRGQPKAKEEEKTKDEEQEKDR
jgi:hypothetical protein